VADLEPIFGGPTKRFFVSMLTRDIELKDSILDLLDNCVDGAMRCDPKILKAKKPFEGYEARIKLSPKNFEISDNCGGIPWEVLQGEALSLGRPNIERDSNLPTIGMYGIGMKRAIFKMAREAEIITQSADGAFKVKYGAKWLNENNEDWVLPVSKFPKNQFKNNGTAITVSKLKKDVEKTFHPDSGFVRELKKAIAEYYGYIIERGFKVIVNGEIVEPEVLNVLVPKANKIGSAGSISPYIFEGEIDEVQISVVVGFYRPVPRESEIWDEQLAPRTQDQAGISIICNDRVVLLNDKSRATGWGEQGVPKYHNQFISIGGILVFSSNVASKLPIATTKRGIEINSEIYFQGRTRVIEGIKKFVNFTNKWKGIEDETTPYFNNLELSRARSTTKIAEKIGKPYRKIKNSRQFTPDLPVPENTKKSARISYSKSLDEITAVSTFLFDNPDHEPREVGESAFDYIFERTEK
jgi:hypothetical protein